MLSCRSPQPDGQRSGERLALLGGTFDPPHVGHVVTAAIVRHALGLEELWLVVANRPWQKVGERSITPVEDRLVMARAAVAGMEGIVVSTIEIDRGGDSYTADTVAELQAERPHRELLVVVGSDAAAGLVSWERADELRERASFVLVDRPGLPATQLPEGWSFVRVEIPRLDVSSTDIRRRVREGEPIDGLVPPAVRDLIEKRHLYRDGQG